MGETGIPLELSGARHRGSAPRVETMPHAALFVHAAPGERDLVGQADLALRFPPASRRILRAKAAACSAVKVLLNRFSAWMGVVDSRRRGVLLAVRTVKCAEDRLRFPSHLVRIDHAAKPEAGKGFHRLEPAEAAPWIEKVEPRPVHGRIEVVLLRMHGVPQGWLLIRREGNRQSRRDSHRATTPRHFQNFW